MNNYSYLFGAFALVTVVFFIHNWAMSSRQQRLERKLEELKAQLKDKIEERFPVDFTGSSGALRGLSKIIKATNARHITTSPTITAIVKLSISHHYRGFF